MSDRSGTTLPLKAIQAALRKTTETLARELANPTRVAPEWSESEWLVARAVSAMHGVSSLLSLTLNWQGPAGWARFLDEQRAHTAQRFLRIQQLLSLIDYCARDRDLTLVGLKGVALHARGLYAPGERPMADIDLLAREQDMDPAAQMIEALGYRRTLANWRHWVFEPDEHRAPAGFGEHALNGIKIELHSSITERLPLRAVDVSPLMVPRAPHPGLNDYPSNAALMSHLLLHAAGSMAFRGLRLLHLHDLSLLAGQMSAADWQEMLEKTRTAGSPWWAFPPLALTARYYGSIPESVLSAAAARCPRLLRRICERKSLSDVSHSDLRIHAFPGIEWSRTPGEALAYARQRLAPNRETISLRAYATKGHAGLSASTWGGLSQGRRIVHWLAHRPSRPEGLYAVHSALSQAP